MHVILFSIVKTVLWSSVKNRMDTNITSRSILLGYRHAFPAGSNDEGTATKILSGYDIVLLWCSNIWKFNNHSSIWNVNIWKSEIAFVVHLKGVSIVNQQRHLFECLDFIKVFGEAMHERWREEFGLWIVSLEGYNCVSVLIGGESGTTFIFSFHMWQSSFVCG